MVMKRSLALICLMLGSQSMGCATETGFEQPERYVYCNVYVASACFGAAGGDVVTMRIPADFVTYDVELVGGAKVLIYSGYNPSEPNAGKDAVVKKYSTQSGGYEYMHSPEGKRVITYTPSDSGQPLLQIVVDQVGSSKKEILAGFLNGFRPCKNDGAGVVCEKESKIFQELVMESF